MAQRRSVNLKQRTAAARGWASAGSEKAAALSEPGLHLLDKRPMRGPFRIPQTRCGMDRGRDTQAFQFRPQRLVVRMIQVAILDERGPDEGSAEALDLGDPMQLFESEIHVLQREHCRGKKPVGRRLAEIRDPIVV